MRTVYVNLPNAEVVQEFVERLSPLDGSFDLIAGNYILDARSLMGIFTLDLSRPIRLDIGQDSPENMEAVAPFLAEGGTEEKEAQHGQ